MSGKNFSDKKKQGRPSFALLLTLFAAAIAVFVVPTGVYFSNLQRESKQQKIIHFQIDDDSASAKDGEINLAQEHCKASSSKYLQGDKLVKIAFANRPEVVIDEVLSNNLAPGIPLVNCKTQVAPSEKVGDDEGTSLTKLMEHVQTLVRNDRAKNYQQPIIITITIENAEKDLDGKLPTDPSFQYIQDIVLNITCNENIDEKTTEDLPQIQCNGDSNNGVFLRIIGPIGTLQTGLTESIGNLAGVKICTRNGINKCIEEVFVSARGEKKL